MILQPLLVVLDLLLDFIRGEVEGRWDVGALVDRHELVLVLGLRGDFDADQSRMIAVKIHRDSDGSEPIEIAEKSFRFFLKDGLFFVLQMPVAGGDCHLQGKTSEMRTWRRPT